MTEVRVRRCRKRKRSEKKELEKRYFFFLDVYKGLLCGNTILEQWQYPAGTFGIDFRYG